MIISGMVVPAAVARVAVSIEAMTVSPSTIMRTTKLIPEGLRATEDGKSLGRVWGRDLVVKGCGVCYTRATIRYENDDAGCMVETNMTELQLSVVRTRQTVI